jgi:hypothetical protein
MRYADFNLGFEQPYGSPDADVLRWHGSRFYDGRAYDSVANNWVEQVSMHEDLPAYGCSIIEAGLVFNEEEPYSVAFLMAD